MHAAAFAATGLAGWSYRAIDVPPHRLADALRGLVALDFVGCNVTLPHKIATAGLVDRLDDSARASGAVNTVVVEGGALVGADTDGEGLLRSLAWEVGWSPEGARALILGAGGSARAVACALSLAGADHVHVAARRAEAASALAAHVAALGRATASSGTLDTLAAPPLGFDVVVQATSYGLGVTADSRAWAEAVLRFALWTAGLRHGAVAVDLVYRPHDTAFLAAAARRGARTAHGIGMLLHQGALAFERWTGLEAPVDAMRAALDRAITGSGPTPAP
jgi:shikimate dehydrogenase